jgi:hypothetical protein
VRVAQFRRDGHASPGALRYDPGIAVREDGMAGLDADPGQDREFWNSASNALCWVVLLGFGLLGLGAAADASDPLDSARDFGVFIVVVLLIFWGVKRHYDGAPPLGVRDLVVEDPLALTVSVPILSVLGLVGLFMASAAETASGYYAGLGLAVGAIGMVFLNLKGRFDAEERRRDP